MVLTATSTVLFTLLLSCLHHTCWMCWQDSMPVCNHYVSDYSLWWLEMRAWQAEEVDVVFMESHTEQPRWSLIYKVCHGLCCCWQTRQPSKTFWWWHPCWSMPQGWGKLIPVVSHVHIYSNFSWWVFTREPKDTCNSPKNVDICCQHAFFGSDFLVPSRWIMLNLCQPCTVS